MKTKTITQHASINNGSFFQAYALQKVLVSLGHENVILDIQAKNLKNDYALFRKNHSIIDFGKNIISLIHYRSLKRRKSKFEIARKNFLNTTKEYNSLSQYLKYNRDRTDLFIAGSDQIWNTITSDFNPDYFLPGIQNKIAYSVSGGTHITIDDLRDYIGYIKEFKAISVREKALKMILDEFGISNIQITVDPTLLLPKSEYLGLINSTPYIKGSYIFLYTIKCEPEVLKYAKKVAKETGLPIYSVFNTYRSEINKLYGIKNIYDAGPLDFLNVIQNAEFVLSDSFHGNVFSVLMDKEFYYIAKHHSDGSVVEDDRIDGFLELMGLLNRKISCSEKIKRFKVSKEDSNRIKIEIRKLKEKSINYLMGNLKN